VKLGGKLHWIPSESFRVREAGEAEMKCADVKYFMYCSLIFVAGALHAQAPASGTQASPPPAAPAGVSPPDAKPGDPAQTATPSNPLDAAAQLYRTGKLAEAEAAYKRILQNEPQSAAAYVGLVHVNLRQKRLPDAEAAIAKAMELSPNSNAVRVAQGEVHFRKGNIMEAQDDFTALVKANVPEARAYLGLGRVYWAESYRRRAKLMFDFAHDKDPDDPDIRRSWLFTFAPLRSSSMRPW